MADIDLAEIKRQSDMKEYKKDLSEFESFLTEQVSTFNLLYYAYQDNKVKERMLLTKVIVSIINERKNRYVEKYKEKYRNCFVSKEKNEMIDSFLKLSKKVCNSLKSNLDDN